MGEEVKLDIPETEESIIVEFIVHYADGSERAIKSGLLITQVKENMEILGLNSSVEDYLLALSAMQQGLSQVLDLE